VYIACGPIYDKKQPKRIGEHRVAVPDRFFKVVLIYNRKSPIAMGFLFDNKAHHQALEKYMVSGNFRDIDLEDLTKHKMDSEQMFVNAEACRIVNEAKDRGNKVCAIGTTVMRAIETAVGTDGHLKEFEGWTNKFIFPPYDFSVANAMVSNFHMPLSTMLMLVCAYGGYELIMDAYNIALKEDYRFGTYGDAMLILDK
jgi:S-adenosylmethionine:tRNA-ribosyltransferase-isomerase (queuine synthetase)